VAFTRSERKKLTEGLSTATTISPGGTQIRRGGRGRVNQNSSECGWSIVFFDEIGRFLNDSQLELSIFYVD